jgi:hypothetical protein
MTSRTKDIDSVVSRQISQTHWQYGLALTKDTRTPPEMGIPILFIHGMHSSVRDNIPVNEAHVVVQLELV